MESIIFNKHTYNSVHTLYQELENHTSNPNLIDLLANLLGEDNLHQIILDSSCVKEFLYLCSLNINYKDFYQAVHNQNDQIQSLENQITPNFSQLQPTPQTYPLPINIQSLTDETDTSAICQEICTQIYYLALPDADIPAANNFAELKRQILTAKRQLQKRHLALILHQCEPDSTLITCCRKIADANLGLHIAWITNTPLDAPLRGFPPQQPNLLGALQTWINELS
ncbi:hypothetical protein [Microcoleus sp.]|uniref:NACHT C-terminal alpha/beta 1 domain-containing protein n=1 Tax=Microcoleus sp. TaxID=44472 RepID=UPI0035240A1D